MQFISNLLWQRIFEDVILFFVNHSVGMTNTCFGRN